MRRLAALLLAACALAARAQPAPAVFDWFEYSGHDAAFNTPLPPGHYRNPVLAGFHADPSVVAANGKFYLVNSSFTFFPGIPVFQSDDLVHWQQIGNVIDRPQTLDFDGLEVSRGIFAPAISYHDGLFYVAATAVDSGGNFIATARDPAGPWSQPHWLPEIGGIDPSLFFDDDGNAYLLNNDLPEATPRYDGHRAIWMQQIDIANFRPIGPRKVLIDGGVRPEQNPIWIEGPHIYKRDGWYYLCDAEGGTGPQHSQVILRSRNAWGPYVAYEHNPILTQRDLPAERALPVTNAGHADMVQGPDGSWWAVFLASRNYALKHYNTGRETYLLPVEWRDGWPVILDAGHTVPYIAKAPAFMRNDATQAPNTGNFTWRDEFDAAQPRREWSCLRVPKTDWADLRAAPGHLSIHPLREPLDTLQNPSFLMRRQQHLDFDASTALALPGNGVAAGVAAFQNGEHWYFLGVRRTAQGQAEVFLEKRNGKDAAEIVATRAIDAVPVLQLKISGHEGGYDFAFNTGHAGDGWQWLSRDQDGTVLSTETAGGFIGAMLGPYARDESPMP